MDCDMLWTQTRGGRFIRSLFPIWNRNRVSRSTYSRGTSSWYYQMRSGSTFLRSGGGYPVRSGQCRFGCSHEETLSHLLTHCPHLSGERDVLGRTCHRLGIRLTIHTMLTDERLKNGVERLLAKVIAMGRGWWLHRFISIGIPVIFIFIYFFFCSLSFISKAKTPNRVSD